jgi:AraC family transcriptional regulator, regulatory protein of adaptative response / DNA-3-methyladenine glycosylase II
VARIIAEDRRHVWRFPAIATADEVRKPLDRGRGAGDHGLMDLDLDACYRAFRTRDPRFDGRLYSGCRTTGIFCRPICPVRTPRRENMSFYPSAAAAQAAGFRPCLRCRPEIAPGVAAWRGTSNTVARALALIEGGALDDASVDGLAERLGLGERQLRRLFREHLGASPVAVAQTRRVLLALQLIRETDLSMANVAVAAGFGSIRRFNEVFTQLFRRSPVALRNGRRSVAPAASSVDLVIRLPYRPPYDWPAIATFLRARAIAGIESVSADRYVRTIEMQGVHGVIAVERADGHALQVAIRFPRLATLPLIIERVRRLFDLAADPEGIDAHLAEDPTLAPLVAARPGLRVPGAWDEFEVAVRAVLGQQITVRAAVGLAGRLVQRYGEPLSETLRGETPLTHVFPRPARIACADLTTIGLPRARARALSTLAAALAEDPHVLGAGRSLGECVTRLERLSGIGEWTAQYLAMRELREPDAFPVGDVGLKRAIARLEGRPQTSREPLAKAERWRPWRAYAAQHLWASETHAGRTV